MIEKMSLMSDVQSSPLVPILAPFVVTAAPHRSYHQDVEIEPGEADDV